MSLRILSLAEAQAHMLLEHIQSVKKVGGVGSANGKTPSVRSNGIVKSEPEVKVVGDDPVIVPPKWTSFFPKVNSLAFEGKVLSYIPPEFKNDVPTAVLQKKTS